MAKRRGNSEGSIYKRNNGTWSVQVTLQGRRLSRTFKTRRECQEWLKKTHVQIDEGMTYASTEISLEKYLKDWLTSTKASNGHRTWQHYQQLCRSYIIPNLGQVKVKDLRPEHIQALYNRLLEEMVGTYTILKIHTLLHSALHQAVKTSMIVRNPAGLAVPPKEPVREMAILNESQVSQLLVAAKGHRWEALYHLAVVTGMRQMEILGLKWSDLDWVLQTLKVERQLVRPDRGVARFAQPKTKYGRRTVALGDQTIAVLRNHYNFQNQGRKTAGVNWSENGLIFTTRVGTPIHPRNLLRDFKLLLRKIGLPVIRFHDLRHYGKLKVMGSVCDLTGKLAEISGKHFP